MMMTSHTESEHGHPHPNPGRTKDDLESLRSESRHVYAKWASEVSSGIVRRRKSRQRFGKLGLFIAHTAIVCALSVLIFRAYLIESAKRIAAESVAEEKTQLAEEQDALVTKKAEVLADIRAKLIGWSDRLKEELEIGNFETALLILAVAADLAQSGAIPEEYLADFLNQLDEALRGVDTDAIRESLNTLANEEPQDDMH